MLYTDTMDKIVNYLSSVSKESIYYKGRRYDPKPLFVSKRIIQGYTCPENCEGCCPRFSLDYLPSEKEKTTIPLEERIVTMKGRNYVIFSDLQKDNKNHFCKYLNLSNGRCSIHGMHPFSCDFELVKLLKNKERVIALTKKFGYGWKMKRIDGGRGALCKILPPSEESIADVIRKFNRLQEWANYFNINTKLDQVISYIQSGNFTELVMLISSPTIFKGKINEDSNNL